ncbi:hypothetical protein [Catelliglobosispora koreensis]|uniref:hypothetical protein n=1 Tax=Catelliglobosispora koreensis TaxID=129052 RepID=UPI000379C87D|nr:hypothetical protein [Catelliglobosispora koreensis]
MVAALALCGLAGFGAARCRGSGGVDFGSVPDWIAAIGTVLSFLAVGVGLLYEMHKRRADAVSEEANQARLVTVISGTLTEQEFAKDSAGCSITVKNYSAAPIFEVRAGMIEPGADGRHTVQMPGQMKFRQQSHTLGPGAELAGSFLIVARQTYPEAITWLEFLDAIGRRWRRVNNGPPTKVV